MDDKILKRVSRRYTLDQDYMDECAAFDDMVNMVYAPSEGLSAMEDAVFFVSPGAHDAEKVAGNIFDTYNPKWDILPRGPEDKENAEELERWLEWHMALANQHGETEPFREMMIHSLRYNKVCAQLDYRGAWDKEYEGGPFCILLHKPYNVHYEMGKYDLRWVSAVSVLPAGDILDYWSEYAEKDKAIKRALDKVEKLLDDDEEACVVYVDYTDKDKRYVACWYTENKDIDFEAVEDKDVIKIIDGENELGFINWAISKGATDGLLTTLHRGKLWQNTNDSESIKRTNAYRRAIFPLGVVEGTGQGEVEVSYDGTDPMVKVPSGKRFTPLNPPPLDPAFNELSAQDAAMMGGTTGVTNLQGISKADNVQFATINAIIQVSLTQLETYKRTVEKALVQIGKLAFKWIKKTGKTEIAYRKSDKSSQNKAGQQIVVGPDDFVQKKLFIKAELIAKTPTDMMQQVNMARTLKEAGFPIPDEETIERLGYGNPEALKERWFKEQVEALAFQLWGEQEKAKIQMAMQEQQAQLQMQQQEAQARMEAQNTPDGPPVIPGGEGYDTGSGGSSPSAAAPQMTQTAMQGSDVTGRGV